MKTDKEIEDLANKIIEYGSAQLCLSGPELETVLGEALKDVEDGNMEKYLADGDYNPAPGSLGGDEPDDVVDEEDDQ